MSCSAMSSTARRSALPARQFQFFDQRVLGYDKLAKRSASLNTTIAALVGDYLELVELVIVADISPAVSADPDDDALLATALAADAEMIVSGDAHVLNLKHYQGVPIVTTVECLRRLGTEPSQWK